MEVTLSLVSLNPKNYQKEFGQILVYLTANVSNMFLAQCWRLEISSRPFYDFNEMTVQRDLSIFSNWYSPFLILPYSPFKKKKKERKKYWKVNVISYWVIEAGCYLENSLKRGPIIQIVQKISEKYCSFWYLSSGRVWWLNKLWFKRYIQRCTLSHVLTLIMTSQIW